MKPITYALAVLLSLSSAALADVVTLKNGDRATGALVTVKGGNLELKSDLGALTIPLDQVTSFSATKPAVVMVKQQLPSRASLSSIPRATGG